MSSFEENVQEPEFLTLNPLNPQINFFQNSGHVTFFTLLTPNFMQSLKKTVSSLWDIQRQTNGRTDRPRTDDWTSAITKDSIGKTRGPIFEIIVHMSRD